MESNKPKKKEEVKTSAEIKIAYFSFRCGICGTYVLKGTNYKDDKGFRMCIKCG